MSRCLITSYFDFRVISKEEFINKGCSRNGSLTKKESKADVAFRIFDENRDGYITRQELQKSSKMTKAQVMIHFKIYLINPEIIIDINRLSDQIFQI